MAPAGSGHCGCPALFSYCYKDIMTAGTKNNCLIIFNDFRSTFFPTKVQVQLFGDIMVKGGDIYVENDYIYKLMVVYW
jgi:hypothetical protein